MRESSTANAKANVLDIVILGMNFNVFFTILDNLFFPFFSNNKCFQIHSNLMILRLYTMRAMYFPFFNIVIYI